VRDVTFDEDRSQVRTGHAPQIMASLRNTAISLLRLSGIINIAAALRAHARHPKQAIRYADWLETDLSGDLSGAGKAAWTLLLVVVPYVGVLMYLIVRGSDMHLREYRSIQAGRLALHEYLDSATAIAIALLTRSTDWRRCETRDC
jgi:hypothetical protein